MEFYKLALAEPILQEYVIRISKLIERSTKYLGRDFNEAKDQAFNNMLEHWSEEKMLTQLCLYPGIELTSISGKHKDIVPALKECISNALISCIEQKIDIETHCKMLKENSVYINIPTEDDDFTKKTINDLSRMVDLVRNESVFSRYKAAKEVKDSECRCHCFESYLNQLIIENNLAVLIQRNKTRRNAQKAIKTQYNGSNSIVPTIYNGESPIANHHIALDFRERIRKGATMSVIKAA